MSAQKEIASGQTVTIPLSDANDLDAVIHALGIEDSDTTPAEAVAELKAEIERLRAQIAESEAAWQYAIDAGKMDH